MCVIAGFNNEFKCVLGYCKREHLTMILMNKLTAKLQDIKEKMQSYRVESGINGSY